MVIIYDLTSHYNQLYHYYVQLYHYHFRLYHYPSIIFAGIMEPQCQVTCLTSWLLWLYITISNYIIITSNYIIIILLLFAGIMEPQCQVTCSWSYTIQPILHLCWINHPTQCWSHWVMVGHTWSWMVTLGHTRSHAHAHDVRCMMFKDRVSSHSASRLL